MIDGLSDYRAAVLRVVTSKHSLEICSKAGDSAIDWTTWQDQILRPGEKLAGEVWSSETKMISVTHAHSDPDRFANLSWVSANALRSCICCPLIARGRTLGTLTLFCGFVYEFSELDEAILWCFAARFAFFLDRYHVMVDKAETEAELEETKAESARRVAFRASERQLTGLLHESKGVYTESILLLKRAIQSSIGERTRLIERTLVTLREGEERLLVQNFSDPRGSVVVDVNETIREIVEQKSRRWLNLKFALALANMPPINVPREDIAELIENLLSNAIRSIREAGRKRGEIEIRTGIVKGEDKEFEIVVQDNGRGIARDVQARIFEAGFTTYQGKGGTGLGLFLVKSIVENYKGRIYCESQFGAWARFRIILPIR